MDGRFRKTFGGEDESVFRFDRVVWVEFVIWEEFRG